MSTEETASKGLLTQFVMPENYRHLHMKQTKLGINDLLNPALCNVITKHLGKNKFITHHLKRKLQWN